MEEQFADLLEKVIEYEEKQQGIIGILFVCFLIGIGIPFVVKFKKTSLSDKVVFCGIALLVIGVFIAFQINSARYINNIRSDILEGGYVIYQGEIVHDNYQKDSFYHNVYIDDGSEKILLKYADYANHYGSYTNYVQMPDGIFNGIITYSAKSKIVLEWKPF